MAYSVSVVPQQLVIPLWPKVRPHLARVAERTAGRYEVEDILQAILYEGYLLWAVLDDDNEITGAAVTSFVQYPRRQLLNMIFLGGDNGPAWKDEMLSTLRRWAADNHCDGLEGAGRLGWAGIFKDDGYKMLWQTFELPLEADPVDVTEAKELAE